MNGLLKFITCGSVDDGKSTLIGHILYDAKLLYADQEKALVLDSKVGSRGGAIDYSLLLDGLMAEREQGITIDVAYRYFTTEKRSFIVADTPGHEEYTRNMAVGASFADLAVILTDASQGVLVQTRRHARICALMGIRYFVFAINKMNLAGYSEERFNEISKEIEALAAELKLESVKIIPVSATEGDNVTLKSGNMSWYNGEALLTYLENINIRSDIKNIGFVLPVQRVSRPDHSFRGFQGQVESGRIAVGDTVKTLPSNEKAQVKSILTAGKEASGAFYGQPVTIQLSKEVDVSRGCVIVSEDSQVGTFGSVEATLLWMDDEELSVGKEYILKLAAKRIPAAVSEIVYKTDVNTGEHIGGESLTKNEIGYCRIRFAEKIVLDTFSENRTLGEFILIDRVSHATSACGVVEAANEDSGSKPYFINGDIKASGTVFEEFYFNIEDPSLRRGESDARYSVGDEVETVGESFAYPDSFDILCAADNAAVLIRDKKVADIIKAEDYSFNDFPIVDAHGFALNIKSEEDLESFLAEYAALPDNKKAWLANKWARFEVFRRIVCTDNFWVI